MLPFVGVYCHICAYAVVVATCERVSVVVEVGGRAVVHAGRNVSRLMQLDMQAVLPWSLALAHSLLVRSVLLVSVSV
mgnify:CR=1 FL=1|jgi:hypothetical protein